MAAIDDAYQLGFFHFRGYFEDVNRTLTISHQTMKKIYMHFQVFKILFFL